MRGRGVEVSKTLFRACFMMRLPMVAMHQPFCGSFAGLLFILQKSRKCDMILQVGNCIAALTGTAARIEVK